MQRDIAVIDNDCLFDAQGPHYLGTEMALLSAAAISEIRYGEPYRAIWMRENIHAEFPEFWQIYNSDHFRVFAVGDAQPHTAAVKPIFPGNTSRPGPEVMVYHDLATRWGLDSTDPSETYRDILAYEGAMGAQASWSPARTAIELLKKTCATEQRKGWLAPIGDDVYNGVPWPTRRAPSHVNRAPVYGAYIHVFDRNSAYLSVAQSRPFGSGEPVEMDGWEIANLATLPPCGLWYVNPGVLYADLSMPDLLPQGPGWYYTPQVKAAQDAGINMSIEYGYVWPQKHEIFREWATHLYSQRHLADLQGKTRLVNMIKRSYTAAIGNMQPSNIKSRQWWHRPDWAGLISSEHYARQVNQIRRWSDVDPGYLAVNVDSVAWVSDEPDFERFAEMMGIRLGGLGGYKHVATISNGIARGAVASAREGYSVAFIFNILTGARDDTLFSDPDGE